MSDPVLQIRDLSVKYNGGSSIRDINVDIPAHQVVAVIGPSGCGKTTLLRSMSRLIELVGGVRIQGQVLFHGKNIYAPDADATEVRKRIGLLAQRPCPLPMSIYENVAYGPRVHGSHARRALDALVEKELRAAGLWDEVQDRLHTPASTLSVGQQRSEERRVGKECSC